MSRLLVIFCVCFFIGVSGSNVTETLPNVTEDVPYEPNPAFLLPEKPHTRSVVSEVCHRLGCFSTRDPWVSKSRPLEIPESSERIGTTFYFYSRKYIMSPHILPSININLANTKFNPDKRTLIIVPSFYIEEIRNWTTILKDVYLEKVDANVIILDWKNGSNSVNYLQAASNARVVGKELSIFIKKLRAVFGANLEDFHLVCHGLGAHVCGYAGKDTFKIGRLTALDPAQLYFEGFPSEIRLDKTDAKFVDVIHTNAKPFKPRFGFGMMAPVGHVDFYINGGFNQPGCARPRSRGYYKIIIENLRRYPIQPVIGSTLHCDHLRAPYYFIEAIREVNGCQMYGHISDWKTRVDTLLDSAEKVRPYSRDCSKADCLKMGLDTEKGNLNGIFVVTTNFFPPYCVEDHWKDRSDGFWDFLGNLTNGILGALNVF